MKSKRIKTYCTYKKNRDTEMQRKKTDRRWGWDPPWRTLTHIMSGIKIICLWCLTFISYDIGVQICAVDPVSRAN